MEPVLLVCKALYRDTFVNEVFTGEEDDILALVESGSFVFDNGNGPQKVGPMEAVNFKANVTYHRHILQPAQLYLFRYRTEGDLFGNGRVIFRDTERVKSTLHLLHMSDSLARVDDFDCKSALFADLVNQYRIENAVLLTQTSSTDQVVAAAIAHINNNIHQKINLSDIASKHFLSYIQFSRRFKNATGATPQEYVAGLRLKKAQLLLSETGLSIKQIAQECGFSSEYYFSNFFRSRCSVSPSNYRTMIQTADAEPNE